MDKTPWSKPLLLLRTVLAVSGCQIAAAPGWFIPCKSEMTVLTVAKQRLN